MKKYFIFLVLIVYMGGLVAANNIEAIYGKNYSQNQTQEIDIFGTNFGSILEYTSGEPHFIDTEYANSEIQKLIESNESLAAEMGIFQVDIDKTTTQKREITDLFVKIDTLLLDLQATSADLYGVKTSLIASESKDKLQISIEENRKQMYDLANRQEELLLSLENLNKIITYSHKFATINKVFIRKNEQIIAFLKECIEFSENDRSSIVQVVQKASSFENDVNELLNLSF